HNRRYLDRQLPQLFAESKRDERPMSLLVLDIDKFKSVNDTYGHEAGDDVLKTFAKRVRACVRGDDLLVRFGGEEVVIVMPDTPEDVATFVAERIRARVEGAPFAIDRGARQIPVTTSIGVAFLHAQDASPEDIFKRADAALFEAKAQGRNRVIRAAA
ncbi:MAG: diguanylate cyclase, partial [Beijerinckiaceae bacterium]